jgi:hypothetical protein
MLGLIRAWPAGRAWMRRVTAGGAVSLAGARWRSGLLQASGLCLALLGTLIGGALGGMACLIRVPFSRVLGVLNCEMSLSD